MKPELKAYIINTNSVDWTHESVQRGYLSEHVTAKSEHEARKELLRLCYEYGVEETYLNEPLTYINLRVKRQPESDKYLVDGKLKTVMQIDYDKAVEDNRLMLLKMLEDNPSGYAYIRKGGYYYCSGYCGYTEREEDAGVYTIEQAVKECLGMDLRDYMRPKVINIDEHNKMINDKVQALLNKRIGV